MVLPPEYRHITLAELAFSQSVPKNPLATRTRNSRWVTEISKRLLYVESLTAVWADTLVCKV